MLHDGNIEKIQSELVNNFKNLEMSSTEENLPSVLREKNAVPRQYLRKTPDKLRLQASSFLTLAKVVPNTIYFCLSSEFYCYRHLHSASA